MIAKHIPMNAVKKSSFASLVRYLTDTQNKDERTGGIRMSNCISDDADFAALEVLNTQTMNTRSLADKTYHLIISFRDGEALGLDTLAAIEDRICDGLGFIGHQRVSVVHHDTDNLHVHVAINKIHPTRYTIHEPFLAYRTLASLCDKLEDDYKLQKDNHVPRKVGAENRAADMEHHAGIESLLGWVKRECKAQMQEARSWEEMHAVLASNALCLHRQANGLVITAGDGTTIKASSVNRGFSKPRLEQRLGMFREAPAQVTAPTATRRYEKKPLRTTADTSELYAQYCAQQAQAATIRSREWEKARARKERRIEAAIRSVRVKRVALKLSDFPRLAKNMGYNALTNALRREIADIRRECRQERQDTSRRHRGRQWADWLRHEAEAGNLTALAALRGRKPQRCAGGNKIVGNNVSQRAAASAGQDSVTRNGTIIYRFGAGAVRDDGHKLGLSIGADPGTMLAALRMALERYGGRIAVNGSSAFKEQILASAVDASLPVNFDDPILEQRRLLLAERSTPTDAAGDTGARRGLNRIGLCKHQWIATARANVLPPAGELAIDAYRQEQKTDRSLSSTKMAHPAPSPALTTPDVAGKIKGAVAIYIAEREQKRATGFDLVKHVPFTAHNAGKVAFAGLRSVEGQMLALLKHQDHVMVLEIEDGTADRLKRLSLGTQVRVTSRGEIRTTGRRR
jgi:hypothetical protein